MALSTRLSLKLGGRNKRCCLTLRLLPELSLSSFFSTQCRAKPTDNFSFPQEAIPPHPKKIPFTVFSHGTTRQDPYRWMRNTEDPDFLNYLKNENSYSQAFMADTESLQTTLVSEMNSRIPAKISTPPERWGPWLYYQYIPEGKEYPVLCRRLETETSSWLKGLLHPSIIGEREQILLDWNQIAEQYGYVHVGACRVSPDHNFLAYTLDITGSEQFMLQILDLRNGGIVPRSQVDGVVSLAWAQDSKTLFYTISDEQHRPYRVLCTTVVSNNADDVQLFTENDSRFCLDITRTKDGKFVTVNSNSRTSSEVYVIDATKPLAGLQRIRKRVSGVQYFVEHHHGFFYILTNAPLEENQETSSRDYYLTRCRVEDFNSSDWQTVIGPNEDISIQDMDMFYDHLVLSINRKGFPMLCSIDLPVNVDFKHQTDIENLKPWFFPLPSNLCSAIPGSNHDFMSHVYRVVLSSPVNPDMIVDYNMSRRIFSIVKQEDIESVSSDTGTTNTFDLCKHQMQSDEDENSGDIVLQRWKNFSQEYICERKEIISHDGVRVPLTILYSQKTWQRGQSPGLLQGYGAYGEVLDKSWCTNRQSLLDRGWAVAFADVRGGSGEDSSWHKSGCGMFKLNSVYDFVSCGNYLVNSGYVNRDRLAGIGTSAGSILVGAAMNMHPDLFRAAIMKVPFLDMLNSLSDPSLPLTILDYEEFGNPEIQSQFEAILSYSPYENIPRDVCLPAMLVTSSFHDSRVGVWEAAKWVAKVRDTTCSGCSRSILLKTNMNGGHFSEGGRYAECEETAYDYAFLMKAMGIQG